jgi:hypothetical protein
MNDVTSYQARVLEELDKLLAGLSETLNYDDAKLNLYGSNVAYEMTLEMTLEITFEKSIEGRFIFIDTLLNDKIVISSRYDVYNDDTTHIFKKPLNKDELEKIANFVSEESEGF